MDVPNNVDNGLVVQTLNYHGNLLTNFFKDLPEFRTLSLQNVDYSLYQSRSKELRVEDRGQRLLLHRFITQNFRSIFRQNEQQKRESCEEVNQDDARAIIPPIETFYRINEDNRTRHFFDMVEPGDVLLCRISAKNIQGLLMNVLGFMSGFGKSRYIRDLRHKAFCPSDEMLPNQVKPYETHDIVCVIVLEVKKENQRLLVTMKTDSISDPIRQEKVGKIPLGQFSEKNIPTLYHYTEQVLDKRLAYNEVMQKNPGFNNPSNVDILSQELELSNKAGDSSLFPSLQHQLGFLTDFLILHVFSEFCIFLDFILRQRPPR